MSDLKANQRKAILCLLQNSTIAAAAECAGVNDRTIYRWLEDSAFLAELRQAESAMIDSAARLLAGGAADVVAVLVAIAGNQSEKSSDRIRAGAVILGNLLKLQELRQLEQRIAELEKRLNEQKS